MKMMEPILHCPICGGEVSICLTGGEEVGGYLYTVTRGHSETKPNCACRLFMESNLIPLDATEEEKEAEYRKLVKNWNARLPMENLVVRAKRENKRALNEIYHYNGNNYLTKLMKDHNDKIYDIIKGTKEKGFTGTAVTDKDGREIKIGDIVHYKGDGISAHGKVVEHEDYGYAIEDDREKTKGRTYSLYNQGTYRIENR